MDIGLLPGDYKVRFHYEQYGPVAGTTSLTIPACGLQIPPNYPVVEPRGKVKQVRGTTNVRGKAINKKVTQKTKFVLIVNPKVGKTKKRTILVGAGKVHKIKPFKAKIGTVVSLKAKMSNGKMKRLNRVTVTPARP